MPALNRIINKFKTDSFIRQLKNSIWMMLEYLLRIFAAIFVSIYIARYLGPEEFGIVSYAIAIFTLFLSITRLGMDSVLVRDLAKYSSQESAYKGTAFFMMLVASVIAYLLIYMFIDLIEKDNVANVYILIVSFGLLFQSIYVVEYSYQAKTKSKISSLVRMIVLGIGSIVKLYIVYINAELVFFAYAYLFDFFMLFILFLFVHFLTKQIRFSFDKNLIKPLLQSGWPIMVTSLIGVLYTRIDQYMIKHLLSNYDLGMYVSATKIYEGWSLVPNVVTLSLLPFLTKLHTQNNELYKKVFTIILSCVFWIGIILSIVSFVYSREIIDITFGDAFIDASDAFSIIMFTAPLVAISSVAFRYLTIENLEKTIVYKLLITLGINVLLNFVLIPFYGIEGAAFATLIAMLISNYFIFYFDKRFKDFLIICNDAIKLNFVRRWKNNKT
jgi:O-antigen/teichoic acid export membrane protein